MHTVSTPVVLIIENDRAIADLLTDVFQGEGYRSLVVTTGEAAMATLDAAQVRLIMLTPSLPDVDPARLLAEMRQHKGAGDAPIVVLTGRTHVPAALTDAADAIVRKPFDLDELLAVVDAARARYRLRLERALGE